jgi:hypothetical protein
LSTFSSFPASLFSSFLLTIFLALVPGPFISYSTCSFLLWCIFCYCLLIVLRCSGLSFGFLYFVFCTCIFVSHFLPGFLTFSLLFFYSMSIYFYFSLFFSLSNCFLYCCIFLQHDDKTYSGTQLTFYVTLH